MSALDSKHIFFVFVGLAALFVVHNNERFVLEHSDAMWAPTFSVQWLLLVSLPVAALVYILAYRSMDFGAYRRRVEGADVGLQ
jgi:hypothetical protein